MATMLVSAIMLIICVHWCVRPTLAQSSPSASFANPTLLDRLLSPEDTSLKLTKGRFKCRIVPITATSKQRAICCLTIPKGQEPNGTNTYRAKCLPTFIIAGTQKSGTTALSAFLTTHPMVKFSSKKEVHFFDQKSFDALDAKSYLEHFPGLTGKELQRRFPPHYAEASPFYIASRYACERIAAMLPDVKMIVLLREPVSRAYSEYQMKKRRVDQQNSFIALVHQHTNAIIKCLMSPSLLTWKAMESCFPGNMSVHPHYSRFFAAFPKSSSLKDHESQERNITGVNKHHRLWQMAVTRCFPAVREQHNIPRVTRLLDADGFADDLIKISQQALTAYNGSRYLGSKQEGMSFRRFHAKECMAKGSGETLRSIKKAFYDEIKDFIDCSSPSIADSVSQLDVDIDRCLKVKPGIGQQFFYRSMYAVQLHRCFKYIPREQFLIIAKEELESSPNVVVGQILAFLGLNATGSVDMTPETVRKGVESYFPHFEAASGWRLQSDYEPIPKELEDYLTEFFTPFNNQLNNMLGFNFTSKWSKQR